MIVSRNHLRNILEMFRIVINRIVRAISKALYRRYATLQQARLSPKSDMINTPRDATIGSSRQMDRYLIYHYRESHTVLSKCTLGGRTAAAVNNSTVCACCKGTNDPSPRIKVLSLNGIGNFCRSPCAFDDLPNY